MKKTRKAGRISNGIYLDYAASTPVLPEVRRVMQPYFSETFGNPGSLHSFGQEAIAAVDAARETIAKEVHSEFREILFTSGATEANNLALRGVLWGVKDYELGIRERESGIRNKESGTRHSETATHNSKFIIHNSRPKVIVSAIEHESVLDTAYALESEGVEVVVLPVDKRGVVDLKKLEAMLDERTVLVSVMYVNNEIGSVQPISRISEIIENFRNAKFQMPNTKSITEGKMSKTRPSTIRSFDISHLDFGFAGDVYPLLHVDAAQALEYFECDTKKLGVDLMTLSSQKIYGPKGAGALFVRNQEAKTRDKESEIPHSKGMVPNSRFLTPEITGGGQEFGLRSGTENVPAIVGFGEAVRRAERGRKEHEKRVRTLKDYFLKGIKKIHPQVRENGVSKTPHILNLYFPEEFAGELLVKMDMAGIAASAGSACSVRSFVPSHVLDALDLPPERVRGSVRFSFGLPTAKKDIDETVRRMKKILR